MRLSLDMGLGSVALMGGGVSPVTILGASLLAWWTVDRADLITLSGTQVTSWKDVAHGYDAVQAVSGARPIYSFTSFNGAPGVSFDGTDDELTSLDAALLAALPDGAEAGEIWAIVQQDALAADATNRAPASYGANTNTTRRLTRTVVTGVNRGRLQIGSGAASSNATGTVVDLSGRHVLRGQVGGASSELTVDQATPVSVVVVPATTNTRLRLGAGDAAAAANFHQGQIRDVLFTGPLSAAQVAALNAWALPRRML